MYVIMELGQFTFYKISGQYLHAIVKVHAYIYIFKSKELITPVKLKCTNVNIHFCTYSRSIIWMGCHGRGHMVVGFTTTYAISA
jgi:hypothetical protein